MIKLFRGFLLVAPLLVGYTTYCQENTTWYSFSLQGDQTKITELADMILYEAVREEVSPYPARIDTVTIVKRLNDSTAIVSRPSKQGDYALLSSTTMDEGGIRAMGIFYPSESSEAVSTTFSAKGLPSWAKLTHRWVFSKERAATLEQAPGYDEVTREAMIAALSVRQEISADLKAYLEDNPDTPSFRMYRFVEQKAQQKFITLGYNPYKPVEYNFEKQFAGDQEVLKLLTEPMSFD